MPELEQVVIQQTGLRLNENEELPPPGSLKSCKNISLQKQGVYSSRRGFQWVLNPLRTVAGNTTLHEIKHAQPFQNGLIVFTNEGVYFAEDDAFTLPPIALDTLTRLGDFTTSSLFFEQEGIYFREGGNIRKIVVNRNSDKNTDAVTISPPINATLNKPPAPRFEELETEAGWLPPNEAVAYRVAWIRETVDGLTYRSAPSERLVVQNTETDNRSPRFTIIPPVDAQMGDKLEVYRSLPVPVTAGVGTPSDTLYLISTEEYVVTRDYTDTRADRGTFALYTNSTQENVANANTPPPPSKVLYPSYYGMTLYGDITEYGVAVFDLEGTIAANNTFTINGQTFIAITSGIPTSAQFLAVTDNKVGTLENLAFVINNTDAVNSSIIAYVIEAEGRVSLGIEALNQTSITISSNSSAWSSSITTEQSYYSRERYNRLFFSKAYEPVSVPSSRYLDIGVETARIIALAEGRGELYVFKEDGIFRITGQTFEEVSVRKIGSDLIAGPDAVSFYKNEIYAICNTGVNRIVYENIQEISQDITPILRTKSIFGNFNLSVVFGDDNERQLFVGLPANESATSPSEIYVFNFQTRAWTQWEYNFEKALSYGGRLMFLEAGGLHWEKKTGSSADYSDLDLQVSLNSRITTETYTHTVDTQIYQLFQFSTYPETHIRLQVVGESYERLGIDITNKTPLSIKLKNVSDLSGQLGLINEREITDLENSQYSNQGAHLDFFNNISINDRLIAYPFNNDFVSLDSNLGWKIEENNLYIWSFLVGNQVRLFSLLQDLSNTFTYGTSARSRINISVEEYNNFVAEYGEQGDFVIVPITFEIEVAYRSAVPITNKSGLLLDEQNITNTKSNTALSITSDEVIDNSINGIGIFGRYLGNTYHAKIGGQLRSLTRINEINNFSLNGDNVTSVLTVLEFDEVIEQTDSFYSYLFNPSNVTPEVINIFQPIERQVAYHNITQGGPTILKLLSHAQFVFNGTDTDGLEIGLETDTSGRDTWYPIDIERSGLGFGLEAYGTDPWGGSSPTKSYEKISIPREYRRHYHLGVKWRDHSISKSVELLGFSLSYERIPQEEI